MYIHSCRSARGLERVGEKYASRGSVARVPRQMRIKIASRLEDVAMTFRVVLVISTPRDVQFQILVSWGVSLMRYSRLFFFLIFVTFVVVLLAVDNIFLGT